MGGVSTYTVLGFTGYGAGSVLGAVLASFWGLDLVARLITFLAPPLAFLGVVYLARRIVRKERIVFYQTTIAGVLAVALATALAGAPVARCIDITVVGMGTFLVFGRLGCFSVACCHGRPARHGIVYGPAHVKIGFWGRWSGRRLWPVQLVECAATFVLVVVALVVGWDVPGEPARIYIVGYALVRFGLENLRGDTARPYKLGLSEAQWTALATALACLVWSPVLFTGIAAGVLATAAVTLVLRRNRRELWSPPHLRAIDTSCAQVLRDPNARVETPLGVAISCHALPDGRTDWVLSSMHPAWSAHAARRVAQALWWQPEVVEGRLAGVIHIITPATLVDDGHP